MQPDHEARSDTVGVPIEGVEIKVEPSGEILVRSPGLLKEYYKNPEATAEVLTADGWYRTGDAGFLDAAGHVKIIDRAKDVGRIAGGANDGALFAPKYVENKLKFFPYIKEAVAFGDKRAKVCVFVNIDLEAVGNWAEKRNLPYGGYAELSQTRGSARSERSPRSTPTWPATRSRRQPDQPPRFCKGADADDGERMHRKSAATSSPSATTCWSTRPRQERAVRRDPVS